MKKRRQGSQRKMSKALKINKNIHEGLADFLTFLLENEKVKAVFTLKKLNEEGAAAYSLITGLDEMEDAVPLYPFMPVNGGKVLSTFSLQSASEEPVAAVLRPCELRAFTELVKRTQGSLKNILLISLSCGGVYPLKSLNTGELTKNLSSYWDSVKEAGVDPGIRESCKRCEEFVPETADMTVETVGMSIDNECIIKLNTARCEDFVKNGPGNITSEKEENELAEKLKKKREENRIGLFEKIDSDYSDPQTLIKTFAPCLGCHACSHACPICFCTLCDFDSKICEYQPQSFISELEQKKGIKVPPGNIFFHIGRMTHMAVSCVRCGMCTDVCPVNIPVGDVFSRVGDSVQKVFEYIPGRDAEEPAPTGTYKEEEFAEVGEQ